MRTSDELVGAAGGSVSVPLQEIPAGGNSIDVILAFDPAVLQATGATTTAISFGATLSVDTTVPGQVRVTISRSQAFTGAGPVAEVQFHVLGAAGSFTALTFTSTLVNSLAVASCGDVGHLAVCSDVPAEVQGLTVSGKGVSTIGWLPGPAGLTYDVTENFISRLRSDGSAINSACLSHGGTETTATDTHATPVDDGFYYLVRAVSPCAKGPFGSGSRGETRTPVNALACP
jgi:hypothetical protein